MTLLRNVVCGGSMFLFGAFAASAQETITLRLGTFLPNNVNGTIEGSEFFISELERLTDGKVEIEFYPAQQAGKAREALELVKVGAIDIYELGTGYFSGTDVPLWGLLEAPNLVKSVCDGTRAMRAVGDPGGILWTNQYEPLGIRVLSYYVYPPYGPSASNKEITSVEDMNGLKLRNAGGLMERHRVRGRWHPDRYHRARGHTGSAARHDRFLDGRLFVGQGL